MATPHSLFTLYFLLSLTTIILSSSPFHTPPKDTHMHLYFHETYRGPNRTAFVVASLNSTTPTPTTSSSNFGDLGVLDDPLREGPEPTSRIIGRAQGFAPQASRAESAYLLALNFVFDEGTLAVLGRAVLAAGDREWAVVGGTGKFRLARGYVLGKKLSSVDGTLIIELDMYFVQ